MAALRGGFGEGRFGLRIPTLAPGAGAVVSQLGLRRGCFAGAVASVPSGPPSPAAAASPGRLRRGSGPAGAAAAAAGSGGPAGSRRDGARARAHAQGEKLEVKCLKVRSLFSMNLLYLILSTNSNLIASGLKPLQ